MTAPTPIAFAPSLYLSTERQCLERLLPGLNAELEGLGFKQLEKTDGLGIRVIKKQIGRAHV